MNPRFHYVAGIIGRFIAAATNRWLKVANNLMAKTCELWLEMHPLRA
jgi:hypothetical protein